MKLFSFILFFEVFFSYQLLNNYKLYILNMCKSLKDLIISQNDSIDIRDCYVQTGIEDIIGQLDAELVGLQGVKTRVREISSVLLFDRIRELRIIYVTVKFTYTFTGRPGTGKTSVATKIALVLRSLGTYLKDM
jgi:hypothetical protein